ncbi:unnamed protein product [Discula destructiva]
MPSLRRWKPLLVIVSIWLICMLYLFRDDVPSAQRQGPPTIPHSRPGSGHHDISDAEDVYKNGAAINGGEVDAKQWRKLPEHFPVASPRSLPQARVGQGKIPRIQATPPTESATATELRLQRQAAVKESFLHSWRGYKKHAWLADEVAPITGLPKNPFGGWAATLVDALDSLWMLGLRDEFEEAVRAAETIDFSTTSQDRINVFETTIRYLGGFLAAYELSGKTHEGLLRKATEVAGLLMCAFDTESHMPIARWDWKFYMTGHEQALRNVLVSELGSLSLEFTKLSQLTGDDRYYDAVQRISDHLEKQQDATKLPGMWPITVDMTNPAGPDFTQDGAFTLGGMADSLYEYFPKQYLVLGGALEQSRTMYEKFIDVAKTKLFRRVYNPQNRPLLLSGEIQIKKDTRDEKYVPKGQHLTCFVGGMVGLAAKIFERPDDLEIAQQLTDGCVWAYESCASGIMPEIFSFAACGGIDASQTGPECAYSEEKWHAALRTHYGADDGATLTDTIRSQRLAPGFLEVPIKSYILRPEAIESVFIMYRLTGDKVWMDKAWTMFETIEKLTRSEIGAWGLRDVTQADGGEHLDTMESFWLAETLKYFYLVFSEFDVVDLDTWVLNTEAHPLRRPDVV